MSPPPFPKLRPPTALWTARASSAMCAAIACTRVRFPVAAIAVTWGNIVEYSGCFSKRFRESLLQDTYLPYLMGKVPAAKGGVAISEGKVMYGCEECNYDTCEICHENFGPVRTRANDACLVGAILDAATVPGSG